MIANQVAISLQNGRMVEALEEKATTDGLTGLTNHRTFQERFSAMLGRAERHQMHVSLGVAVYPEDGKSKQELISNADQALHAAKHSGRNRTVCHGEIARAKDAPPLARAAG